MYSIILFIGLPGSGKTFWAKKTCDVLIDDITSLNELPTQEELGSNNLGITDVNFCDKNMLEKAVGILKEKFPKHEIGVSYFENDPIKCKKNVQYRNDGRNVDNTIDLFSKIYTPPSYARKIWQQMP